MHMYLAYYTNAVLEENASMYNMYYGKARIIILNIHVF